jgi:hypothetical protein
MGSWPVLSMRHRQRVRKTARVEQLVQFRVCCPGNRFLARAAARRERLAGGSHNTAVAVLRLVGNGVAQKRRSDEGRPHNLMELGNSPPGC